MIVFRFETRKYRGLYWVLNGEHGPNSLRELKISKYDFFIFNLDLHFVDDAPRRKARKRAPAGRTSDWWHRGVAHVRTVDSTV